MRLQNSYHKLQRPIAREGRAALSRLLLVRRFTAGKLALAGVMGWRKCLFSPMGPERTRMRARHEGRMSIMGYGYSIRNALYTFSDECTSCLISLQQPCSFLRLTANSTLPARA